MAQKSEQKRCATHGVFVGSTVCPWCVGQDKAKREGGVQILVGRNQGPTGNVKIMRADK